MSNLEVRKVQPDFAEGEQLVRQKVETRLVNLPRPLHVLVLHLFPERVVDPQVNVPPPVSLLLKMYSR